MNEIEQIIHDLAQYAAVVTSYSMLAHAETKDASTAADLAEIARQCDRIAEATRKLQRVDWQKSEIVWRPSAPVNDGPAKI